MIADGAPRSDLRPPKYANVEDVDQAALKSLLRYDPETGLFHWLANRGKAHVGDRAGRVNDSGYVIITISGRKCRAHRLAWLYVYGVFPTADLDHKNGITTENWIENLREATDSQNVFNTRRHRDNACGLKGVSWHKGAGRWRASIQKEGRPISLGLFDTAESAHEAYATAAKQLFGEFARLA